MSGVEPPVQITSMNPDQVLIRAFQSSGVPIDVDSNPLAVALGMCLKQVDAVGGVVELGFKPGSLFIQGAGVIQGGAITTMLDFAMAFATLACLPDGRSCASVNLNTSFMRPARASNLTCVGRVTKRGRQIAFASAELLDDCGGLVASATSALAVG